MEVLQHGTDTKGYFYIDEQGKRAAEMTYVHAGPGKFIIDHTEVKAAYEGKGLGKLLVEAAVNFARSNHFKIMPLCPYAKHVFDKTPAYADVRF